MKVKLGSVTYSWERALRSARGLPALVFPALVAAAVSVSLSSSSSPLPLEVLADAVDAELRQRMRKSGNHPVGGAAQLYHSSFLSPINPQSPPKNVEILAIIHVEPSKLAPGVISSRFPVAPSALQLCSSQTVCAAIETPSPPSHRDSFIGMEEVKDEGAAPPLPSLPWNSPHLLERESLIASGWGVQPAAPPDRMKGESKTTETPQRELCE
ncbi:hypothetical protein B0H13DRAFT_1862137 [Mycena leptocephala]|nr:hypothetical protein B0H13DRAFT_1862137 [Mycena leptocephala]